MKGPIWRGGRAGEPALLASCYRNCLAIAARNRLATIAFPAISAGVYGYPLRAALEIAVQSTRAFVQQPSSIAGITFCAFSAQALAIYEELLAA